MATENQNESNLVIRFDRWLGEEVSPRKALLIYTALAVYFLFLLVPIAWFLLSSFETQNMLYSGRIIPRLSELTIQHYIDVLTLNTFQQYAINSVIIASSTSILCLVFGTLAAYSLSRFEYPGRNYLLVGYLSTQMLPRVLVMIPFFTLMFTLGFVDSYTGIILAHTAFALPFGTWMIKGYFDDIPKSFDEAAKMDGASQFQLLRYVILPLAVPGMTVAGFYTFIISWNDFLAVSILSQTSTTRTLPFGLQLFQSANSINWPLLLTAASITMIPVIVLFTLIQRQLVQGLASGGLKGG